MGKEEGNKKKMEREKGSWIRLIDLIPINMALDQYNVITNTKIPILNENSH